MKKSFLVFSLFLFIIVSANAGSINRPLNDGWKVQIGNEAYRATLPASAMGILIQNNVYRENVLNDSTIKSVDKSRFSRPWLLKRSFRLDPVAAGQKVYLKIDGLNYAANILVNGKLIASPKVAKGAFRSYSFDVTNWISDENDIMIQLRGNTAAKSTNGHGASAIDGNMGILGGVSIEVADQVKIQNTRVMTKVMDGGKEAALTIEALLENLTAHPVKGVYFGKVANDIYFYTSVSLKAGEKRVVRITPKEVKKLLISNPTLWWCNGMGAPSMYNLQMEFDIEDKVCDKMDLTFPARQLTGTVARGYLLNGKKLQLKSAGSAENLYLIPSSNYTKQLEKAKELKYNVLHAAGSFKITDALVDNCNRNGILLLP